MELTQLRTFREVAETLNFTRAAERLHLTQSAVSHQIKALEQELGEPLFIRAKRGVRLSEAGKAALDYARRILDETDALKDRLSGGERTPEGRVRAAAATQAFVHLFAPLFECVHAHLSRGRRDLPHHLEHRPDPGRPAERRGRRGVRVPPRLLAGPPGRRSSSRTSSSWWWATAHRLADHPAASLEDLKNDRLILFERGNSIRRATDQFFHKVGVEPTTALESNDTAFIKLMVERGLGISLLPAWAVRDEVRWGWLAQLRIKGHRLRRTVAILSLGKFQPTPTRAFVEFMGKNRAGLQAMAEGEPMEGTHRPAVP